MPLFSSSSSPSAAATLARLPGFLRQTRVDQQKQLFNNITQQERERFLACHIKGSPFYIDHAVQESTLDLNRYRDIVPYQHSQIHVSSPNPDQYASTFINANRITTPASLRSSLPSSWKGYIATQAPIPQTQPRFWKMVYEQNVHVIVCLTAVSHDRIYRSFKAERYWPLAGQTDKFDNGIHVRNLDKVDGHENVVYRHFEIWNQLEPTIEMRQLLLVHYQGWPDHGVPSKTDDLRDILYKIRKWKLEQSTQQESTSQKDFGPMVVHCSAGCGRTGTFCVIDTALSVLEQSGYPSLAPSP
ncbi:Tyrosine-protein phosphatase non-receptor type 6, partial [Entomortierella lignicola]